MGQQQLLLVILVTILVGIATVVAINVFGESAEQANADAVRQDLLSAAAQAQAIWTKPEQLGGAGGSFENIDAEILLTQLRIPGSRSSVTTGDPGAEVTTNFVENENGRYTITPGELNLIITGEPSSYRNNIELTVTRVPATRSWTIEVEEIIL